MDQDNNYSQPLPNFNNQNTGNILIGVSAPTINIPNQQNLLQGLGTLYPNGINGNITIGGTSFSYGTPLTKEEQEELDRMMKDHQEEIKLMRIDNFKKLAAELRQTIVDIIFWRKTAEEMKVLNKPMPARLIELTNKKNGSGTLSFHGGYSSGCISCGHAHHNNTLLMNLPLNALLECGLSEEDIIRAHKEACAEEALTEL